MSWYSLRKRKKVTHTHTPDKPFVEHISTGAEEEEEEEFPTTLLFPDLNSVIAAAAVELLIIKEGAKTVETDIVEISFS